MARGLAGTVTRTSLARISQLEPQTDVELEVRARAVASAVSRSVPPNGSNRPRRNFRWNPRSDPAAG